MTAPLTPAQIAAPGTELAHQSALFAALVPYVAQYPALWWFHHIPNGGERNPIVASRLKASGAKKGVWDLFLPAPCGIYHGLYIEMKKPAERKHKQGGLSDEQVKFGLAAHEQGYKTYVCYTWEEALTVVLDYVSKGRSNR